MLPQKVTTLDSQCARLIREGNSSSVYSKPTMMKGNMTQAIEQLKKNWLVAVMPVIGIFLLYACERDDESNARVESDIKEIKSDISEIKMHTTVIDNRLQDFIANHNRNMTSFMRVRRTPNKAVKKNN